MSPHTLTRIHGAPEISIEQLVSGTMALARSNRKQRVEVKKKEGDETRGNLARPEPLSIVHFQKSNVLKKIGQDLAFLSDAGKKQYMHALLSELPGDPTGTGGMTVNFMVDVAIMASKKTMQKESPFEKAASVKRTMHATHEAITAVVGGESARNANSDADLHTIGAS